MENLDLLHLAALPFTREVGFPSAVSRELDVARMERSLRALARNARSMLESVAGHGPLRWSFRVTRGALAAELLAAAGEADLLLVCPMRANVLAGAQAIRLVRVGSAEEFRAALQGERGGMLVMTGDGDELVRAALSEWPGEGGRAERKRNGKDGGR